MVLTKKEIVEMVCTELGISKKESTEIVESFFEIIKDDLTKGNDVIISGFGKWSVMKKDSRRGRNPQTGEKMTIDARRVVTFKGAPNLRSAINYGSFNSKGG